MGTLSSTSPNENTAESPPSNEFDNKITVEQVPKPRKFFKSRNSTSTTDVIAQQQQQQQQQIQSPPSNSYQNHVQHQTTPQHHNPQIHSSSGDEEYPSSIQYQQQQHNETPKRGKKKEQIKKVKPEKPPKIPKPKPEKKVKEVVVKPTPIPESTRQPRQNADGTRSSGRTRAKCVNYNEDADEADFMKRIERRVAPKRLIASSTMTSPSAETQVQQAPIDDSFSAHPPIVLRISKASLTSVTNTLKDHIVFVSLSFALI
jgi:hypothetical protein